MKAALRLLRAESAFRSTVAILLPATVAGAVMFARVLPAVPADQDGPPPTAAFFAFIYPFAWAALHRDALRDRASLWQLALPVSARTLWVVRTGALLFAGLIPVVLGPWLVALFSNRPEPEGPSLAGYLALGIAAGIVTIRSTDVREPVVSIRALVVGGVVTVGTLALIYSPFGVVGAAGVAILIAILGWRAFGRLPPAMLVVLDPPVTAPAAARIAWPVSRPLLTVSAITRVLVPWWLIGSYLGLYLVMMYFADAGGIVLLLMSSLLVFSSTGFALPILRRVGRLEHLPVSRRALFRWIAAPAGVLVLLVCVTWFQVAGEHASDLPLGAPTAFMPLIVSFLSVVWLLSMTLLLSEFRAASSGRRVWLGRSAGLLAAMAVTAVLTRDESRLLNQALGGIVSMVGWSASHLAVAVATGALIAIAGYRLAERQFTRLEFPA